MASVCRREYVPVKAFSALRIRRVGRALTNAANICLICLFKRAEWATVIIFIVAAVVDVVVASAGIWSVPVNNFNYNLSNASLQKARKNLIKCARKTHAPRTETSPTRCQSLKKNDICIKLSDSQTMTGSVHIQGQLEHSCSSSSSSPLCID